MKTKNIILLGLVTLLSISGVNADYRIYDNVTDFENAKGSVCEAATDGCNNYFMNDGKVMGGTLKMCPETQPIVWTCTKYKENTVTTKMITTDMIIENTIANKGNLSDNDYSFYNVITTRLDDKYQNAVNDIVVILEKRLEKYTESKQEKIKELLVEKLESKISQLLLQYPQDVALPKSVNNKYFTYTLLKFELLK